MSFRKKLRRKLGALLYYAIGTHLPHSWSGLKIGQTAFRRLCGKLMLADKGKVLTAPNGKHRAESTVLSEGIPGRSFEHWDQRKDLRRVPHRRLCHDGLGRNDHYPESPLRQNGCSHDGSGF